MYSATYAGIIVSILGSVFPKLGISIGSDDLTTTISVLATVLGGLWAFWGRYRKGGVTLWGTREQ